MLTFGPQLDAPLDGACRTRRSSSTSSPGRPTCRIATDFRGNDNFRRIWKEPVGVVGAIVPWNYPFEVSSPSWARPWPPATRSC